MSDEIVTPCPFCGVVPDTVEKVDSDAPAEFFVACNNCYAAGPYAYTTREAVTLWNDRTPF